MSASADIAFGALRGVPAEGGVRNTREAGMKAGGRLSPTKAILSSSLIIKCFIEY